MYNEILLSQTKKRVKSCHFDNMMDLESTMLSEISQRKTNTLHSHEYVRI